MHGERERTKLYRPFKSSAVNSFPSRSFSTNGPPTLGRPTPLLISAIRFRSSRSFSTRKYTIIPAPVITNSSAAFHENGPVELRAFSWPIVRARLRTADVVNDRCCSEEPLAGGNARRDANEAEAAGEERRQRRMGVDRTVVVDGASMAESMEREERLSMCGRYLVEAIVARSGFDCGRGNFFDGAMDELRVVDHEMPMRFSLVPEVDLCHVIFSWFYNHCSACITTIDELYVCSYMLLF